MALRAVLFGLEGVLIKDRKGDQSTGLVERRAQLGGELRALFDFLRQHDIRPIIVANRDWTVAGSGPPQTIDEYLTSKFGEHSLYVASRGMMPFKPRADCVGTVLEMEGLDRHEAVMVGMSLRDFQTAKNGKLLFLNAAWDRQEVDYGFRFDSPVEVLRFIELFGLKEHHWFYKIDEPIRYRSLAPFSTLNEDTRVYSEAARNAAKDGTPERHFFLNTLVSSLYFTGEIDDVDYIACVPGHAAGYGNEHMDDVLEILGGVFGKRYIRDLIVRHRTVPSQRRVRQNRGQPSFVTQLNSICLTRRPLKNAADRYSTKLKLNGRRILLFDDFMTEGYTFEAVRLFLAEAGASVTMVSWLKTINRGYHVFELERAFDPYQHQTFRPNEVTAHPLPYREYIVDHEAPQEIDEALARFRAY